MKTIIIASMGRNGVIGRTSVTCPTCNGRGHDGRADYDGACGDCGALGRVPCNDIPWNYPEDMKHFRDATMGHAVIMGRRTWESLPPQHRPLKGRTNIVVSRKIAIGIGTGAVYVRHLKAPEPGMDDALWHAQDHEKLFVIGGAQLFAAALPLADELDLTLISRDYDGDAYFPRGDVFRHHGLGSTILLEGFGAFECIERRQGSTPELAFTRWCRK